MNTMYKEIEAKYKKVNSDIQKTKNSNGFTTGGVFDRSVEKKYSRALDSWNKYFVGNKNLSPNITYINSITFKTNGDITKSKEFYDALKTHQKYLSEITKKISSKDIKENSYITIFLNTYDLLTNSKYISAFKVAYDEYNKNKGKVKGSISDIFIMCNQILVSYLFFTMGTLNPAVIGAYAKYENDTKNLNDFVNFVETVQDQYKSIIKDIGFVCIELSKNLENIKNPADELKKAIKSQNESTDKIAKAKESADSVVLQNSIYEVGEENYIPENLNEYGSEEALTVALIVLASIVGLVFVITAIRRAIYMCGTIKTDITEYIKVDVVTVMMNIESLKEKLDNTTDEKERKKLQSIIDKQQKFVDKFKDKYTDVAEESNKVEYEADYVIKDEDDNDSSSSSSSDDDYSILL